MWIIIQQYLKASVSNTLGWSVLLFDWIINIKCLFIVISRSTWFRLRGAKTWGGWGDISPPIVWEWSTSAYPPRFLMGLHQSENLGKKVLYIWWRPFFLFVLHLNLGRESVLFLTKTFFFVLFLFFIWSSPEFGKKKCSIFNNFFFFLHLNSGRKSVPFAFSLVFTKFPHLSKIVVEVHPPNVENRVKLQIIPQCSTKIGTTV